MFVHASLLAGLALVAAPVLIHFINMLRHRRVRWAAMTFLMASQKRNRTWVFFKQLLLLLARMTAVALIVLVVAKPVIRTKWGRWFGGIKTHHVVLLDDSYSMSDRWGDSSAFQEAKSVVGQIAEEAARQVHPQQFTLFRFSRTARADRATQPDLLHDSVDSEFAGRLRERLQRVNPSQMAVGPAHAIQTALQMLGEPTDEQRVVYVISDIRASEWASANDLRNQLLELNKAGAVVVLVACAREQHPNLTLTELSPVSQIQAAGVPMQVQVAVQNHGPNDASNVTVAVEEDGYARPGVIIPRVPAGKTGVEKLLAYYASPGEHRLVARLETDAVAADNTRYCVVSTPIDLPVLVVDGDSAAGSARFLNAALSPRGPVKSGIRTRIEAPGFLSLNPLSEYRTIYLLDVGRLDESAISSLESYTAAGGSLVIFAGVSMSAKAVNEDWYRDGRGFFPIPIVGATDLEVDRLQPSPDLQPGDHPMFRIFAGERNSALATVNIWRYLALPKGWRQPPKSTVREIARLRNGHPLAFEHRFGNGVVVAVLTSVSPQWNNWATDNPTFLASLLSLQAYLAERRINAAGGMVGTPLRVELDGSCYERQVRFSVAHRGAATTPLAAVEAIAGSGNVLTAATPVTETAGYYEAVLTRSNGQTEKRVIPVNVDPAEGNLALASAAQLETVLAGVKYTLTSADAFQAAAPESAGANLSQTLLYAVIVVLLLEQALARSASYHLPDRRVLRGGVA